MRVGILPVFVATYKDKCDIIELIECYIDLLIYNTLGRKVRFLLEEKRAICDRVGYN